MGQSEVEVKTLYCWNVQCPWYGQMQKLQNSSVKADEKKNKDLFQSYCIELPYTVLVFLFFWWLFILLTHLRNSNKVKPIQKKH